MGASRRAAVTTHRAKADGRAEAAPARLPRPTEAARQVNPAFHRAILKIALELKKPSAPGYDAIVEQTISAMRLDPEAFRRYLGENGAYNMGVLLATARGGGL